MKEPSESHDDAYLQMILKESKKPIDFSNPLDAEIKRLTESLAEMEVSRNLWRKTAHEAKDRCDALAEALAAARHDAHEAEERNAELQSRLRQSAIGGTSV